MKRILIVDDNDDSRELVKKILKKYDYEIIEAIDGEDAIAKAVTYRPDLILMDISIPKMDGYEVTRRLKARPDFKATSIIAFTAHAMRGDQEKAFESGCDGYISKPINVREFPEQIKVYLKEK
ncbi:MAG TPA: response regulator [Thermodesulfovibrio thiophilus]|uniref:response regulator n=1 Tax=Thermodesulfovibrio thiophilus TaxID=340095 RepID=UPI00179B31C6|nr:response regulator [Thermodesulfovibrio thiophilus]HHW20964.1 response regulator [Thermodesulfovibrio thiophilus]HOA83186.1 response regulator [Thermodesulfovibrio thiophilus]HQA03988.1 response regulator [Thermodesulfovibrio thiophilus]HQD36276.1 response regulator [Thermodesulfovibrio thiophilus]